MGNSGCLEKTVRLIGWLMNLSMAQYRMDFSYVIGVITESVVTPHIYFLEHPQRIAKTWWISIGIVVQM
jgi:hypothetical protein